MNYQNILNNDIILAPLGILSPEGHTPYFCTPKDACIFGVAGVDGIHYCFIPGFDEMVFAVSPMNTPGNYIHPLAYDLSDFLRLLLACKSADALEQAWQWDQAQFTAYINDIPDDEAQKNILAAITDKTRLTPMDDPWQYLHALQSGFDYSRLPLPDDPVSAETYPDADADHPDDSLSIPADSCFEHTGRKSPEWKVYFNGGFYGKCPGRQRKTHAGTELPVRKNFLWDKEACQIPSVYSCSEGLVIDFLQNIPADKIKTYMEKWNLSPESTCEDFDHEQLLLMENDNPLSFYPRIEAVLNGKTLTYSHSTGSSWNPLFSIYDTTEMQMVLQHYLLDPSRGWTICRSFFPWKTKHKPQIKTLAVRLSAEKQTVPGPRFHTGSPGIKTVFTYPSTGTAHTLTVMEYTARHLDASHFHDSAKEYPGCYTVMGYTITPALPHDCISVTDCSKGDKPRELSKDPAHRGAEAVSVIIGHADGPTSIFFSDPNRPDIRYAASAPHFKPAGDIEWQILFHEQRKPDLTVNLIG